jgi:hypothetical protein
MLMTLITLFQDLPANAKVQKNIGVYKELTIFLALLSNNVFTLTLKCFRAFLTLYLLSLHL